MTTQHSSESKEDTPVTDARRGRIVNRLPESISRRQDKSRMEKRAGISSSTRKGNTSIHNEE